MTTQVNAKPPSGLAKVWPIDGFVTFWALAIVALLTLIIALETATFLWVLFLVACVMGVAMFHSGLGFTGAWRNFVLTGKATGMRAQLLLLGLAALIIVPFVSGAVDVGAAPTTAPLGISLLVGAFIFGFGMQLGGACGSGTLFTLGSGNQRMLVTFVFFIVGAFIGSMQQMWWLALPSIPAVLLYESLGTVLAIALQLAFVAALWWWFGRRETRLMGKQANGLLLNSQEPLSKRLLLGPWALAAAAVILVLGNLLTVILSGSPWGITFAYALWGAKVAQFVGVDVASNAFWITDFAALSLQDSVLVNVNSVMAMGIILGAMLAAGLANRFAAANPAKLPWRSLLAAVIGGLLMGYGGRIGFGCNIGALFSGVASASLHAWVWFALAFAGSYVGIKVRPWFGLAN